MGRRALVVLMGGAAGVSVLILVAGCSQPAPANPAGPPGGATTALSPAADAGAVAATIGEQSITVADLDVRVGNRLLRLRAEEYKLRRQALDELVATTAFEREAAARGVSVAALLDEEVERKARPVTDEEAAAVYESAPERFRTVVQADARRSISNSMHRQRVAQRREAFTAELIARVDLRVLLQPPRVTMDPSNDPSRGPADAPVTIIEFSDFQCPYCAQVARVLPQLEAQYPGQIRLVFRDFPLPMHKDAGKAAEAAACAGDQGKYWQMHDRLFAGQKALGREDLARYAADVGLQAGLFARCLDSGKYTAEWQADRADGGHAGVTGTPAFFVNGRPLFGAVTLRELAQVVEEELAGKRGKGVGPAR